MGWTLSKPNCKYVDDFGNCLKKPKVFGIFKVSCIEYGTLKRCDEVERYDRPIKPPAQRSMSK